MLNRPPGILYCFISSYDVVFIEQHHFTLPQNGLAFLVRLFHRLTTTFESDEARLGHHRGRCYRFHRVFTLGAVHPEAEVRTRR